jgi:hypothetical protein
MNKLTAVSCIISLTLTAALNASAATSKVTGVTLTQLKAASANFGECTIRVNKDINTEGTANLECPNSVVVSLGCDGSFHSKGAAINMFSTAQMALALDKTVTIWINDQKQYNESVCTAESVIYSP